MPMDVLDREVADEVTPVVRREPRRGPLRVGLIGSGKMGLHHVKAIAAAGDAVVVGVADPAASEDELRPLIGSDAVMVGSAEELLVRVRPDVVHIVTPPATHARLADLAIRAGCHVYVEKPFTATTAEAAQLLARAEQHGVKLCVGHQLLFERPALAALETLPSIGRLVHVESYFSFKMVRRTISAVEQVKDILPHAVYPVIEQMRRGTGITDAPIEVGGVSVDPAGEVYALLQLGAVRAVLLVTLNGRPIEQYQQIVGTNGSLRVDYIAGSIVHLSGSGTGPGVLFTPFRRAWQTWTGATRGFSRLILGRAGSYQGLHTLVHRFYSSIREDASSPVAPSSILDTVSICERIGQVLDAAETAREQQAGEELLEAERKLPAMRSGQGAVLVTGGTGLLGTRVARELRQAGIPVRVLTRRLPPSSKRLAGVEYAAADLAQDLDASHLRGVDLVVHCAAETSGGRQDHQRNSVDATQRVLEAAAEAGVARIVHVSSVAVLKTSREVGRALDEDAPVDEGNMQRGAYVWGKAESEMLIRRRGPELGLAVKIVRPGPLVDYAAFQPPGRLGREIGPMFVAVGPKHAALSVCDVTTAARVIRSYVEDFEAAPDCLNLIEAPAPTRRELIGRYLITRRDLRVFWVPAIVLRMLAGPLKFLQRVVLGSRQPVDVAAAFASERYQTDLAARVIERAMTPASDATTR
jgi:predicted dehydrogenase/nucleoside-diphosphate-sugar epimerase